jgi:hypothetical protein
MTSNDFNLPTKPASAPELEVWIIDFASILITSDMNRTNVIAR